MRKKTIRQMSPESRKLARLINDLDSVSRRLKNYLPIIQRLELDSRALKTHTCTPQASNVVLVHTSHGNHYERLKTLENHQEELFKDDGKE